VWDDRCDDADPSLPNCVAPAYEGGVQGPVVVADEPEIVDGEEQLRGDDATGGAFVVHASERKGPVLPFYHPASLPGRWRTVSTAGYPEGTEPMLDVPPAQSGEEEAAEAAEAAEADVPSVVGEHGRPIPHHHLPQGLRPVPVEVRDADDAQEAAERAEWEANASQPTMVAPGKLAQVMATEEEAAAQVEVGEDGAETTTFALPSDVQSGGGKAEEAEEAASTAPLTSPPATAAENTEGLLGTHSGLDSMQSSSQLHDVRAAVQLRGAQREE